MAAQHVTLLKADPVSPGNANIVSGETYYGIHTDNEFLMVLIIQSKGNKHFGGEKQLGRDPIPAQDRTFIEIRIQAYGQQIVEGLITEFHNVAGPAVRDGEAKWCNVSFPPVLIQGLSSMQGFRDGSVVPIQAARIQSVEMGAIVVHHGARYSYFFNHGPLIRYQ